MQVHGGTSMYPSHGAVRPFRCYVNLSPFSRYFRVGRYAHPQSLDRTFVVVRDSRQVKNILRHRRGSHLSTWPRVARARVGCCE